MTKDFYSCLLEVVRQTNKLQHFLTHSLHCAFNRRPDSSLITFSSLSLSLSTAPWLHSFMFFSFFSFLVCACLLQQDRYEEKQLRQQHGCSNIFQINQLVSTITACLAPSLNPGSVCRGPQQGVNEKKTGLCAIFLDVWEMRIILTWEERSRTG